MWQRREQLRLRRRGRTSDWLRAGGAEEFFADKDVTVVLPTGAYGTFYTDWERRDPSVGKPTWEIFLTQELPPLIDAGFDCRRQTGDRGATPSLTGANADNMWGPVGSGGWRDHAPARRLDQLRGKTLFLYAGAGQLGPADIKRDVTPDEGLYQVVLAGQGIAALMAGPVTRALTCSCRRPPAVFDTVIGPIGAYPVEAAGSPL
ncbi:MAG: hypothetical protein CME34_03465 [Gordonia sp.]|uniref:alpha/beta hydrolase-fold protein n=1 Tax=Gordonia sp. (in: high G+C Gram-positive bacteria) TaxID=84139 RepID=UPI000C6639F5|nr:alpha/beta hydrolase-fold protein [Gordonia sp. (in: high G+C Gram-positive bacteria)]MAU80924.1 hypothetical protein [Gordonia sp. (in: high G+C Gram-positive bacteria)]